MRRVSNNGDGHKTNSNAKITNLVDLRFLYAIIAIEFIDTLRIIPLSTVKRTNSVNVRKNLIISTTIGFCEGIKHLYC
jgi:hypothetical protein